MRMTFFDLSMSIARHQRRLDVSDVYTHWQYMLNTTYGVYFMIRTWSRIFYIIRLKFWPVTKPALEISKDDALGISSFCLIVWTLKQLEEKKKRGGNSIFFLFYMNLLRADLIKASLTLLVVTRNRSSLCDDSQFVLIQLLKYDIVLLLLSHNIIAGWWTRHRLFSERVWERPDQLFSFCCSCYCRCCCCCFCCC